MDKIESYLKKFNINKKESIVVACSGGPDSMFLLSELHSLNYNVICAHVNHNVRKESEEEYSFVKNYCDINNIIFEGMKIDNYNKDNFHQDARNIRYKFFEKILKKYNAKYLATAHHGDDLIETILMRITRGSTLEGYAGFKSYQITKDNYIMIRPLVKYTKSEIKELVENKNIPYRIDQSNESDKYTRNRYRHHILPILKKENENIHLKYLEYNEEVLEASNYIKKEIQKKLPTLYENKQLNLSMFKKEDIVIQKGILNNILTSIYKDNTHLVNNNHIKSIFDAIKNSKPQIMINFPNNIKIAKNYSKLIFDYKEKIETSNFNIILKDKIILPSKDILEISTDKSIKDTSNYTIRLNSQNLTLPFIVRNRQDGDKMIVKNMMNYKKVKEIFIENKIENSLRNSWPIVTDSAGTIIWIPGLKKSNLDVKLTDKYDIIIQYNLKGERK